MMITPSDPLFSREAPWPRAVRRRLENRLKIGKKLGNSYIILFTHIIIYTFFTSPFFHMVCGVNPIRRLQKI